MGKPSKKHGFGVPPVLGSPSESDTCPRFPRRSQFGLSLGAGGISIDAPGATPRRVRDGKIVISCYESELDLLHLTGYHDWISLFQYEKKLVILLFQ